MKATTHQDSNSFTCAADHSEHGMSCVVSIIAELSEYTSSVQRTVANICTTHCNIQKSKFYPHGASQCSV